MMEVSAGLMDYIHLGAHGMHVQPKNALTDATPAPPPHFLFGIFAMRLIYTLQALTFLSRLMA